jgi:enoyl-CoA hydratase
MVLTGSGDKAFAAGSDISELVKMNPLRAKLFSRRGQNVFSKIEALPIPVIAAVNGYALGGGFEAALSCDFIYASEQAVFGLPEINLGLIPGFGGTQRLARLVGSNRAKELIFTAKDLTAQQAFDLGLVNKITSHDALMRQTLETAHLIASKGRTALQSAKEAIHNGLNTDLETGCRIESDGFGLAMTSPDAKEGTTAFLEKRKPQFNSGFP